VAAEEIVDDPVVSGWRVAGRCLDAIVPIKCFGEKPADRSTPAPDFSIVSRPGRRAVL
jgi:hypothetical protein